MKLGHTIHGMTADSCKIGHPHPALSEQAVVELRREDLHANCKFSAVVYEDIEKNYGANELTFSSVYVFVLNFIWKFCLKGKPLA